MHTIIEADETEKNYSLAETIRTKLKGKSEDGDTDMDPKDNRESYRSSLGGRKNSGYLRSRQHSQFLDISGSDMVEERSSDGTASLELNLKKS